MGIWMWKSVRVQLTFMGTTVRAENKVHVKVHQEGISGGCHDCSSPVQSHSCFQSLLSPSHTKQATDSTRSSRDIGLMTLPCISQYLALLPQDSPDERSFQAKRSYTQNGESIILYINILALPHAKVRCGWLPGTALLSALWRDTTTNPIG